MVSVISLTRLVLRRAKRCQQEGFNVARYNGRNQFIVDYGCLIFISVILHVSNAMLLDAELFSPVGWIITLSFVIVSEISLPMLMKIMEYFDISLSRDVVLKICDDFDVFLSGFLVVFVLSFGCFLSMMIST
jgi:hypothetical protein